MQSVTLLYVRSIPKNIDKLNNYLLLLDIQFSIIGLTEYKSIDLTRPSRKGGASLYIHKNYDYVEKPNMNIMIELIECLFVEVMSQTRKHKRKILVVIVYRPQIQALVHLQNKSQILIILMEFNVFSTYSHR